MASFMNDWTLDHIAGYEPRSVDGRGAAPDAPGPRDRAGPRTRPSHDSRMTHAERGAALIASRRCFLCAAWRSSRRLRRALRPRPPPPDDQADRRPRPRRLRRRLRLVRRIDQLEAEGYTVIAPANPLRGVAADAAYLKTSWPRSPVRSCSSATPTAAW